MRKYYLGIDLGTGSAKAVAIDNEGKTLATSQRHYDFLQPQPGFAEQDPEMIWQAFLNCLEQITDELGGAPLAVSFSSAMHSVVPVDNAGKPLMNAMLWSDARSGTIAEDVRNSEQAEELYRHTGTAIYAMSPLCKIMWIKQLEPEIFAKTHKFISIKEYVWFKLFGVYEVDHSIASSTGMFDIIELKWYEPALQLAGIETSKLSTPVETTFSRNLARSVKINGLNADTLIFTGASDGCCANLGGNAIKAGVGALTIGTSGAVRVGSDRAIYNFKAMTFNYLLKAGIFICGGAVNNGGGAVNWLLQNFLKKELSEENYNDFFRQVESVVPGSEGLIFLPYLYAERAPIWDAKSSAAFINISAKHQQAHFLRAGLEGVCFALNDVLHAVEQAGAIVNELVISGGFIASPVWVQILADITGKRLVILQSDDASAIGAVYLAMEAMGVNIETIMQKELHAQTEINPNPDVHAKYEQIFTVYQGLYNAIEESVHQLQSINLL